MLLSCQTLDVLHTFYIFFGTNLLTQCQVPVPVFSMFLTPFRGDFETESKRNKIPEKKFFFNGRRSGDLRANAGGAEGPHKPSPRGQGEAAAHRLVAPLDALCPRGCANIFPKNPKKLGDHRKYFSAAASFCLRKIPSGARSGALSEGGIRTRRASSSTP